MKYVSFITSMLWDFVDFILIGPVYARQFMSEGDTSYQ